MMIKARKAIVETAYFKLLRSILQIVSEIFSYERVMNLVTLERSQ